MICFWLRLELANELTLLVTVAQAPRGRRYDSATSTRALGLQQCYGRLRFLQRLKGGGAAPCLLRDRHPGLWRSSRPKVRCSSMTAPCASVLALVFVTVTGKLLRVYLGRDLRIQTQVATQGSTWIMSPTL